MAAATLQDHRWLGHGESIGLQSQTLGGALTRCLDAGQLPIDKNWLFVGSLRAGLRAAAVMRLIQSAKLNGHDPYAYEKDVLTRLPTQRASQGGDLRPIAGSFKAAVVDG